MMDNFHINVISEGRDNLKRCFEIILDKYTRITGYRISLEKGLIFLQYDDLTYNKDNMKLPFTLDVDGATDFAMRWLSAQDYGNEPDHDGDNGKGWQIYTEGWGHVGSDYHSVCAVKPAWAMYGK